MLRNQTFTGTCTDYTYDGLGVVRNGAFCVFVKDMIKGETGEIIVTKAHKDYAYGHLKTLVEQSRERVIPVCPISRQCGGCQLQHMSYKEQLAFKQHHVEDSLKRIGGIEMPVEEIMGCEKQLGYRNKCQVPVGQKDDDTVAGFYRVNSHDIIPFDYCPLQPENTNRLLKSIVKKIDYRGIGSFFRHILIKEYESTGQIMAVLVTNSKKVPFIKELADEIVNEFPDVRTVVQNVNGEDTNVILGKKEIVLKGSGYVRDKLGDLLFDISSRSFYQVNSAQTYRLYSKAVELADLKGDEMVLDLYCGVGTIGLFASRHCRKVIGIEIVEEAVADARRNAELNGIENAEFICGDAGKVISEMTEKPDVVFVDPPRKGCNSEAIEHITRLAPERLVYISCNPATLARDLKVLGNCGYRLRKVQPVDMFPQTYHVETVCCLYHQK